MTMPIKDTDAKEDAFIFQNALTGGAAVVRQAYYSQTMFEEMEKKYRALGKHEEADYCAEMVALNRRIVAAAHRQTKTTK